MAVLDNMFHQAAQMTHLDFIVIRRNLSRGCPCLACGAEYVTNEDPDVGDEIEHSNDCAYVMVDECAENLMQQSV